MIVVVAVEDDDILLLLLVVSFFLSDRNPEISPALARWHSTYPTHCLPATTCVIHNAWCVLPLLTQATVARFLRDVDARPYTVYLAYFVNQLL